MNVLIDLDGTLTDAAPGIVACIRHALVTMERDCPSNEALRAFIGPPLHETFAKLLDSPESVATAMGLYRKRFVELGMLENSVYAGIPEALASLKERGASLYVATSKPLVYAAKIVQHFGLGGYFKTVHGSELDGTRSSKTDLIAHVLRTESLAPEETCMVGDRSHDVVGAKANGVRPIGVLWGYGSREELESAGASVLCQRPDMLARCIA